jgi:uncharacterized protein with PIN domain
MPEKTARFRFYAELNDFLPGQRQKTEFPYPFSGTPSVKDAVEAIGVPHPEVDLVIVNGMSVSWDYRLRNGDLISVYPVFEGLDISPLIRLRAEPLRESRFVVDGHLGKLARLLRMLGFDTHYDPDCEVSELVCMSLTEGRIILTHNRGVLKIKEVTHGYWVRSQTPREQVREVLLRLDLFSQILPFHRCMVCNGTIEHVEKSEIAGELPEKTKRYYDEFYRCAGCDKVYWKGSHHARMKAYINKLREGA